MFFAVIPVAFAGVVQDYIHQYYRAFESRYRDPVAGQPNQPAQPYRTNIINALDAVVTCLYSGPEGSKNWQFGGTQETATTSQLINAMNSDASHPCHDEHVAVYNAEQAGNNDPNGKYAPVVVRDRADMILIWRNGLPENDPPIARYDSNQGSPSGRDQAARTKLNAFDDCLMQNGTNGQANWRLSGITDSSTGPQLRDAVRNSSGHPCQDELETSVAHRPEAVAAPSTGDTPPPEGSTPGATEAGTGTPLTSTGAGASPTIDDRPLYQRIVEPRSEDVLTPGFASGSTPSISGLMNFLFDLLVRRILPLIVGVMVIFIVWGGYQYIMAAGDPAKVKQARDIILYSIIAMILALSALTIVTVLNTLLLETTP